MNTVDQPFDSRAMPLLEPSTAPIAFSLWDWLAARIGSRASDSRPGPATSPPERPERAAPHTPR